MPSTPSFDSAHFRAALGRFATGVTIITTQAADGSPIGMAASSFNSVSLEPPLVLWSLGLQASSYPAMTQCERYVIHVLAADHVALARRFATGKQPERFADLPLATAPNGTLMLADESAAWFECRNRSQYQEGDHLIMVGEVEHCGYNAAAPLIFHAGGFALTPAHNPQ
ncbi:MAG TPA: flavin reductase family protein [Bordetella sp.]